MDNSIVMFCLATAALVVAAMLFPLLPLFRQNRQPEQSAAGPDLQQLNINLRREQLAELKKQRDAGQISAQEYAEQESDLEMALLTDLQNQKQGTLHSATTSMNAVPLVLIAAIPVLVASLYLHLGASDQLRQKAALDDLSHITNSSEKLMAVEKIVRQWPDDLQTRYMLASFYMSSQRFAEAANHFGILVDKTSGQDADPLAQQAQALYMANNGETDKRILVLVHRALTIDPDNTTALDISGITAYDLGDYALAVKRWTHLLPMISQPDAREALVAGIAAAQRKMGLELDADSGAIDGPTLKVKLSLDSQLSQLPKTARVFLYACPTGTSLPLNIQTLTVADLPGTFDLGKAEPMQAGAGIKPHQIVDIIVRIAVDGDVMKPDYEVRLKGVEAGLDDISQVTVTP